MNAQSKITATPAFTLEQAQAIATYAEAQADIAYRKRGPFEPWQHERWDALKEIEFCALAVLDALDGVEGYGYDAHAALQREMEAFGCDSIWRPLEQLRMAGSAAA